MTAQEAWRLEADEVELVASSHFHSDTIVSVISILCNWGPPVSGRFDPDFLDVWVVGDESVRPKSVALYGSGTVFEAPSCSNWRDIGEFAKFRIADIHGRAVGLYHFSGLPVDEFVVRLTDDQGNHHYDNNGGYGVNYHLRRHHGFQLNYLRAGADYDRRKWILVFPRIVEIQGREGIARLILEAS